MDSDPNDSGSLNACILQLERERDELRRDIEQLCMQQAGPGYVAVATRMHFQRTAGLEQEIENLKMKVIASTRENTNLQEELSEAYRIKGQLADLHAEEVSKNAEAEKQIKFFQGCVAAAFAERDHSLMEAEKAKEKEECLLQNVNDLQKRVEEITASSFEEKKLNATLQSDLAKQIEHNENFEKVVDKFYKIRQQYLNHFEDTDWDKKCACLLQDSGEHWSVNNDGDTSASTYISALEEELDALRKSVDDLHCKLQMGLDIENHLKKRVSELEKKRNHLEEVFKSGLSTLLQTHSQQKVHIGELLDEGKSYLKSVIDNVGKTIEQQHMSHLRNMEPKRRDIKLDESDCRDVHISPDAECKSSTKGGDSPPATLAGGMSNASDALALALQEKVAALLLLSQQEERHLLERNVNAALQKKVEELKRNLLQVTNEKVKALMEMAQLKLEYQFLQEKIGHESQGNPMVRSGDTGIPTHEKVAKLKGLFKKTYLGRWAGAVKSGGHENEAHLEGEGNVSCKRSNHDMDFARMKIENAALKESIECIEQLTSSIQRLRLSFLKAKESVSSENTAASISCAVENIVTEAKLVKTALGISLPVSWSAEARFGSIDGHIDEPGDAFEECSNLKVDWVSATGFEMVELLILAAQMLKDNCRGFRDET